MLLVYNMNIVYQNDVSVSLISLDIFNVLYYYVPLILSFYFTSVLSK